MDRHDLHAFIDGEQVLYEGCKSLEAAKAGASSLLSKFGPRYGGSGISKFQSKDLVLCHLANDAFCTPDELQALEAKTAQEQAITPEPALAPVIPITSAKKPKKGGKKGKKNEGD